MSENETPNEDQPTRTQAINAQKVERQKELIAKLEKKLSEKPSEELKLELLRGRDRLRHLSNVQKEKPQERANSKYQYAAKSALSRAIQAVEE